MAPARFDTGNHPAARPCISCVPCLKQIPQPAHGNASPKARRRRPLDTSQEHARCLPAHHPRPPAHPAAGCGATCLPAAAVGARMRMCKPPASVETVCIHQSFHSQPASSEPPRMLPPLAKRAAPPPMCTPTSRCSQGMPMASPRAPARASGARTTYSTLRCAVLRAPATTLGAALPKGRLACLPGRVPACFAKTGLWPMLRGSSAPVRLADALLVSLARPPACLPGCTVAACCRSTHTPPIAHGAEPASCHIPSCISPRPMLATLKAMFVLPSTVPYPAPQ